MSLFGLLNPLLWLLPVVVAVWYLRQHRDEPRPTEGRRRLLRGLSITMLVLFVGGFGVCGAFGVISGVASAFSGSGESRAYGMIFLIVGGIGLAIAAFAFWLFRRLIRPTAEPPAAVAAEDSINPFDER
jgi:uncharacterized BrkB/YihY/UPF0761 family membrane protein